MQDDHAIVDSGPDAVVRHPINTAVLILYLGTALAFPMIEVLLLAALASLVHMLKTS